MKKFSIPFAAKAFFAYEHFKHGKKNILIIFPDEETAFKAHVQLQFLFKDTKYQEDVFFFPSFDTIPYDRISPSAHVLSERANVLTNLSLYNLCAKQAAFSKKKIIVTSAQNLITKLPPTEYFLNNSLYLTAPLDLSPNSTLDKKTDIKKSAQGKQDLTDISFFRKNYDISGSKISMEEIAEFLVRAGFSRSATAIDSGEFSIRGEILDVVTENTNTYARDIRTDSDIDLRSRSESYVDPESKISHSSRGAYRINFGFDGIESIKEFDVNTQISTRPISSIMISPASEAMLTSKTILSFKNNFLKFFGVNHSKSPLYEKVISGSKFQAYEHLLPLLFDHMVSIFDYVALRAEEACLITDDLSMISAKESQDTVQDFYQARLESNKINPESTYYAIPPENIILNNSQINELTSKIEVISIRGGRDASDESTTQVAVDEASQDDHSIGDMPSYKQIEKISSVAFKEGKTAFDVLFDLIVDNKQKIPVIFCSSQSSVERIKTAAADREYVCHQIDSLSKAKKNLVNITIAPLAAGFLSDDYLFVSEQDIWGDKFSSISHKSSQKKLKNILNEIDNIEEGQLVVHTEHGVGRFDKVETIKVHEQPHDCLKIIYAENDILYLPVENIDTIKKFGSEEAPLDKLGGLSWQKRKAKVKGRIKDIADKLVQITAQRLLQQTTPNAFDKDAYEKFCSKFPYSETDDQLSAISDIMDDLDSGKLMDRLVCGDVGFGKTEVAMRAAFMCAFDTASNKPQIAVISPTTILCRQHYENFMERFRGFGLKIVQLSRLVGASALKKNKEDIKEGRVDIIIGTHALLAKDIAFSNLKMIIIDEEQHFGVSQKERLKQLKVGVHVMSLSATPIPRTLQMSMLGIKDLSLIATAPVDRLPVRTSILPFDPVILRDALMRERFRGGRSFFVCPRIKDIEEIEKQIKNMVPELTYRIAHGQMSPGTIDEVMSDFSEGKFDILLSTTIIESGIDIPAANTIIINRSDMLGLSQLYQLRGRVGRGKMRGYAYLTLTPRKKITKHSLQRLEVLQNIDSLGAGFTIASHDMDIRGFGNLVGDQQSGHVKEVGVELYQDMLESAIRELKVQEDKNTKLKAGSNQSETKGKISELDNDEIYDYTPTINLGLSVYIPQIYIDDSALRLAMYRRVGKLRTDEEISKFKDEMIDRFGLMPPEFINLLEVVKLKIICYNLKIQSLDSGPGGFVLKFNEHFNNADMVMEFIKKNPRHSKIKENNKLVYMTEVTSDNCLKKASELLEKF